MTMDRAGADGESAPSSMSSNQPFDLASGSDMGPEVSPSRMPEPGETHGHPVIPPGFDAILRSLAENVGRR